MDKKIACMIVRIIWLLFSWRKLFCRTSYLVFIIPRMHLAYNKRNTYVQLIKVKHALIIIIIIIIFRV